MPTLEENVNRVKAAKTAIGNAITAKGGIVRANDGLEEFAADIATIPSGSSAVPKKDVNFYDYDGTIVNSYTAAEFANLTAMPDNPTHDGLTAQGWNWSLSDAKTYVADYGKLEIGQMYITSDGKTRLYISLPEGRTSPILQLYLNANSELDIDWGDGSEHSTFITTTAEYKFERHNYASAGAYVIVISVITGGYSLKSKSTNLSTVLYDGNESLNSPDSAYNNSIKKIEVGTDIIDIGDSAFRNCCSLTSITIPNSVTSFGIDTFQNCYSLTSITIPNSVTSIADSDFYGCTSLTSITIPNSVTSFAISGCYNCYSLATITIPDSVTGIGDTAFRNCYSLTSVTIPSSVSWIGIGAFRNCSSMPEVAIPSSVISIYNNAFNSCYSLATIKINKAEGSISGSPWGATTSSPTSTQIVWTG